MEGACGEGLKTLLKNTCEEVHLLVKLPAISLQACKFTKNELFFIHIFHIFDGASVLMEGRGEGGRKKKS